MPVTMKTRFPNRGDNCWEQKGKTEETEYRVATTCTSENGPQNDKLLRSQFLPFPCPEFYLQLMINSFRIESMCNGKTKWSFMFMSTSRTIYYIVYTFLDLSRVPRRPDQTGTRATECALTQMVSRLCMHECCECAARATETLDASPHFSAFVCSGTFSLYTLCVNIISQTHFTKDHKVQTQQPNNPTAAYYIAFNEHARLG